MWYDMNGWWMVWGTVMMLVLWGSIFALAVWAAHSSAERERFPLDIARQRYARGEISRDQFEEIQRELVAGTR